MSEQGKQILVAEDNNVLSDVLRFNLERAGFRVTVARTGREALGFLESQSFDLVITDYQMPELDGESLCRHVREAMRLEDLPVLLCTAKGLELDLEQLRSKWRLAKVIYKPFSVREVLATVQALVAPQAIVENVPV
jgi:CheY-like chemotaxis protein